MPAQSDAANISVGQFAERCRREMIPLRKPFSYYFAALPLTEEDIREYLEEPIAALPPLVVTQLPRVSILLVPYLEKAREKGRTAAGEMVRTEKPSQNRVSWMSCFVSKEEAILAFALKDQEVADYHYRFYHLVSELVADHYNDEARRAWNGLLREELSAKANGEVDEESWTRKQKLQRRQGSAKHDVKLFEDYSKQAFIDTMTLYLHGICCDIDVETGPRQLPSRYLRKRLQLLRSQYPPPEGYAVFPEEVKEPASEQS
jgi:hypothetical protein